MDRLFGTDGIRGIADEHPITGEVGARLGRSLVRFCMQRNISPIVVIGRDTRESGKRLEDAVTSGVISAGGQVMLAGVLPTPGVAFLTRKAGRGAGVVLSASHNPHEYNGFKVFSNDGFKLSEEEEIELESMILDETGSLTEPNTEQAKVLEHAGADYISFLMNTLPEAARLQKIKLVIDCANGATFRVAPALFRRLGMDTEAFYFEPDGKNINRDCGSQHTETLSRMVPESGADLGLAFDGDGDRLIAVDEKGSALTGDQILMICSKMLLEKGELKKKTVVSTVMSNMGFGAALKDLGVRHVTTPVGDRHVVEEMRKQGAVIGGEDSGHIVFLNHHTTGDGILSALQLLSAVSIFDQPLSVLSRLMTIYPQTLINVQVKKKPDISSVPEIAQVIRDVEDKLAGEGRVLVRYSGTEPLCRVMVEGKIQEEIEKYAHEIADLIAGRLNV